MSPIPLKKTMRVLAVFVLTVILVVWVRHEFKKKAEMPSVSVTAAKVKEVIIKGALSAIGVVSTPGSTVISPEVSGTVKQIFFAEGASVKQGELLITLDSDAYKAQLDAAKAQLLFSQENYRRDIELNKKGFVTSQALSQDKAVIQTDEANVAAAQAALNKTEIKAPFDGIIGKRLVNVGSYVAIGAPVTNLIQSSPPIQVDFALPETVFSKLAVGQKVEVTTDASPDHFEGTVSFVSPSVDSSTHTVAETAVISAPGPLRPGFFVEVTQYLNDPLQVLSVPEESLTSTIKGQNVYKIDVTHHTVSLVPVELKRLENIKVGPSEKPMAYVTAAGLKAGDSVVTTGLQSLKPGSLVNY